MHFKTTHLKPFGVLIEPKYGMAHVKELDIEYLRTLFWRNQLIILRGYQTFQSAEDFSNYCYQWGDVSIWPFGKVLELVEHEHPKDHIFDTSYVPLHWDGMYRPQVPEYQIFHCVQAPLAGQGGRTTFSNTLLVLEHASDEDMELWGKVTGIYRRTMEFYNSKTISPIITQHPYKNVLVIRYNEPHSQEFGPFINPPDLEFTGLCHEALVQCHQSLKKALYSPNNYYAHEWQSGDIVIADNFSLLHGRECFTSKSPRHLQRVHVLSDPPYDNPGLESYE